MKHPFIPFGLKPTEAADANAPRYADFYARGLAAAIDLVVLFSIFQRPFDALNRRFYAGIDHTMIAASRQATDSATILRDLLASHLPQLWLANFSIQMGIIGVVLVGMQCWVGTTPGKWLLGLRILDSRTMQPPARWRYIWRFFMYFFSVTPLMLGVVWMSFNKRHRSWHDMLARTVVVYAYPRGFLWQQIKRLWRTVRERLRKQPASE